MTPALFYLLLALGLIGTELLIMQLSVFWFLFVGLGALAASLSAWLIPSMSWVAVTSVFLVSTIIFSALLYPRLKKWQSKPAPIAGNDAIGQSTTVIEAISADNPGKVIWSGTEWPAQVASGEADLKVGDSAVIRDMRGIRLIVGH